jgi:predicted small integral membrane protein
MYPHRDLKILFSLLAGAFLFLVGLTNATDYPTNLAFVRQVTQMEDLFSGEALKWRSIRQPWLQHLLYVCIIVWEILCGWLAILGAWRMFRARRKDFSSFSKASMPSAYAYGLAVALWFGGFVTVAGEWFLMWRGGSADTQGTALLLTAVFILLLIFHTSSASEA